MYAHKSLGVVNAAGEQIQERSREPFDPRFQRSALDMLGRPARLGPLLPIIHPKKSAGGAGGGGTLLWEERMERADDSKLPGGLWRSGGNTEEEAARMKKRVERNGGVEIDSSDEEEEGEENGEVDLNEEKAGQQQQQKQKKTAHPDNQVGVTEGGMLVIGGVARNPVTGAPYATSKDTTVSKDTTLKLKRFNEGGGDEKREDSVSSSVITSLTRVRGKKGKM
jgi:hypothetical protein